jgi:CRISPR system Cascade subunit CasA
MHDLIHEPVLSTRDRTTLRRVTLPGLLAELSTGTCIDFPRVRPHQHHPWAMFLAQVAAHAMRRAKLTTLPQDEEAWRAALLALTDGSSEPWSLVVDDLSKPALLQPPVPEGTLLKRAKDGKKPEAWNVVETADSLDVLVTSKRHDIKSELVDADEAEFWTYALVTLQTTQGYPHPGQNGVARMNGGYGNRPRFGLSASLDAATCFQRDVQVLLSSWAEVKTNFGYVDDGVALVWLEPWDGKTSLSLKMLAPHFVEVCQRVRLQASGGALVARVTTSEVRRCAPEVEKGDLGDPWIPIKKADPPSAFTVGPSGFEYRKLVELLFSGDYQLAKAQERRDGDAAEMWLLTAGMARGQSKTDGLHERRLRMTKKVTAFFAQQQSRDRIAARASSWVQSADTVRSKVLYPALKQLAAGFEVGNDKFFGRVDESFFEVLFATIDDTDDAATLHWQTTLLDLADSELTTAIDRLPTANARFYSVLSAARGMFAGLARKHLPDAWNARHAMKEPTTDEGTNTTSGGEA